VRTRLVALLLAMCAPAAAADAIPPALLAYMSAESPDLEVLDRRHAPPEILDFLASRKVRQSSPFACAGDLDGDGLRDVAVLLRDRRAGTLKVMAFHRTPAGGYRPVVLADLQGIRLGAEEKTDKYLVCEGSGRKKQVEGGIIRVKHDAVTLATWEKACQLFYFDKGQYRSAITCD
jgi:hypothetical protein